MPPNTAVRGLRRAELITTEPLGSAKFHAVLLDWLAIPSETGFDCWVGERRCAMVRTPQAGEPPGWRLIFAGGGQDGSLCGPDDTAAELTKGRAQHGPWAPRPRRGEPCWVELFARDPAKADEFWTDTLSWTVQDELPDTTYAVGGRPVATRTTSRQLEGQWGWLCYFAVEDIDAAGNRIRQLGGKIVDSAQHPVLGETLVAADPSGAVFALALTANSWGSGR